MILAFQLFSGTVNEVFGAFNSRIPFKEALYKGSTSHETLSNFLSVPRTTNNTFASERTLESLQVTIRSTLQIADYLWSKGYKYVLTGKLNQNSLERHFGVLRSLSCDDPPSTIDFLQSHLLQCIYVPAEQALSLKGNCEPKVETSLTSFVNQMRL